MGYLMYRDNDELTTVAEQDQQRITLLCDDLELVARQQYHDNEVCGCDPGKRRFWKCISGPMFVTVDPEEVLALAFARGLLKLP